jgi:hypothetical protein
VSGLFLSMIYTHCNSVELVNPPNLPWIDTLWNTPFGEMLLLGGYPKNSDGSPNT